MVVLLVLGVKVRVSLMAIDLGLCVCACVRACACVCVCAFIVDNFPRTQCCLIRVRIRLQFNIHTFQITAHYRECLEMGETQGVGLVGEGGGGAGAVGGLLGGRRLG